MSNPSEVLKDIATFIEIDALPEPIGICWGRHVAPEIHVENEHATRWLAALEQTSVSHHVSKGVDFCRIIGNLPSGLRIDVVSLRPDLLTTLAQHDTFLASTS
jgi:hypothetical protein